MMQSETYTPPLHWGTTLFLLGTPLVALAGIPWYIAVNGISLVEILTALLLWYFIGLAITAGYHRLFSHRSFDAPAAIRLFLLVLGAGAIQTSALKWCYKHRAHHAHVDSSEDPYNIRRGFWWAHIGWVMHSNTEPIDPAKVKDLLRDPLVVWQDKYYHILVVLVALGIPLLVGILSGHLLGCLLIGCVGRIVLTHHVTFFINSLCHLVGRRPYSLRHSARDSGLMAVLAFGEGYHNYHHTFPFDYRNGIRFWHIDPAKWLIATLSSLRLATRLKRAPRHSVMLAKAQVQYAVILRRLERAASDARASYQQHISEAFEAFQQAALRHAAFVRAGEARNSDPDPAQNETREALSRALEGARQRWRMTVHRYKSLPAAI